MDLQDSRRKIDEIDEQMVALFSERMEASADIGRIKAREGLPITDPAREREKLYTVSGMVDEKMSRYVAELYSTMFDLSKAYQARVTGAHEAVQDEIEQAIRTTMPEFPDRAMVACQGIEGAFSQVACERLFSLPSIMYFSNFNAVFTAIEKGLCRYGVLPIENSTAGSVNQVYDLMMKHRFRIVRSVRVKVDHCLAARKGVKLNDLKEVISHEQALAQCAEFLKGLGNVRTTAYENTAAATKAVAESGRDDVAAICSKRCADLYGLECLQSDMQDQGANFTRFICISKDLEIYPGADKTSIMAVTTHTPGALYKLLGRFYAFGVNLTKLESRPLPDRNFEFMFYFDLEKSVNSPGFAGMIGEISELCEQFEYLGSYSEVV